MRVITTSGRIGTLQLGASTQAAVAVAVGTPEAEGTIPTNPGTAPALGLGYECSDTMSGGREPVGTTGPPYCATAYYVDVTTGRLGGFWTVSNGYATSHGTRVGTPTQTAARRERHPAVAGCLSGIMENNHSTYLVLSIRGGKIKSTGRPNTALHIVGGRVSTIEIESRHDPVGILFC